MSPYNIWLFVIFAVVQVLVVRRALVRLGRRVPPVLFYIAGSFPPLAYLCSITELMTRLGMAGPAATVIGAIAYGYFIAVVTAMAVNRSLRAAKQRLRAEADPGRRRLLAAAGNAAISAPFLVIGYGTLIQRTNFHVREIDLAVPGLPRDLDGLRLLHVSDIHLSPFLSEAELARVIDGTFDLKPHLTVVTGDLITSQGDPLEACIRQLARLRADAGVFGCMGNHERYAGVERFTEQACARVGIEFLRGRARQLRFGNASLNLAGVDYQSMAGRQAYLRGAERMIARGGFNVLLSHNPDVFPVAARQGYNLLLAGHTHGGQVNIEILDRSLNPARFLTPYIYGVYGSGNSVAYVTRGIGTIGIPARICAPPEIALLRLKAG